MGTILRLYSPVKIPSDSGEIKIAIETNQGRE